MENLIEYEGFMMKSDEEKELTVIFDDNYDHSDPEFNEWIKQQEQKAEEIIKSTTTE